MTSYDKKLIQYFSLLSEGHKELVLEFMEFLGSRYPNASHPESPVEAKSEPENIPDPVITEPTITEPILIPRPESESVIAAIKRLSQSYPMLNKEKLFDKTSILMTAHIMQGRDVVEVIDEIELVFKDQHEDYLKDKK